MSDKNKEVISYISEHSNRIIQNISIESINIYEYLCKEYCKSDISKNSIFQFVFRSYYGLDNAGLSYEFKETYFELLEESKTIQVDFKNIAERLHKIKNIKQKDSLQISFTSKLVHTVQNDFPIYDSKVANLLGFSYIPATIEVSKRIDGYLNQIESLKELYNIIANEKMIIEKFKQIMPNESYAGGL